MPVSMASRKLHGGVACDLPLPLTGTPGIEPRSGGPTGDHQLAITFSSPVTLNGTPQAQVTSGIGQVGGQTNSGKSTITVNGSTVLVPLPSVASSPVSKPQSAERDEFPVRRVVHCVIRCIPIRRRGNQLQQSATVGEVTAREDWRNPGVAAGAEICRHDLLLIGRERDLSRRNR